MAFCVQLLGPQRSASVKHRIFFILFFPFIKEGEARAHDCVKVATNTFLCSAPSLHTHTRVSDECQNYSVKWLHASLCWSCPLLVDDVVSSFLLLFLSLTLSLSPLLALLASPCCRAEAFQAAAFRASWRQFRAHTQTHTAYTHKVRSKIFLFLSFFYFFLQFVGFFFFACGEISLQWRKLTQAFSILLPCFYIFFLCFVVLWVFFFFANHLKVCLWNVPGWQLKRNGLSWAELCEDVMRLRSTGLTGHPETHFPPSSTLYSILGNIAHWWSCFFGEGHTCVRLNTKGVLGQKTGLEKKKGEEKRGRKGGVQFVAGYSNGAKL